MAEGIILKDGSGEGNKAAVDKSNRLKTVGEVATLQEQASIDGRGYNINTGIMTLTSASKSAVLYFKNTGACNMVVSGLFYLVGNSTSGSGDTLVTVIRNPTAGTIVSNSTTVEMSGNRNFGSSRTIAADAFKGGEAVTMTGGEKIIESIINQSPARVFINVGAITLTPATSIGIDYTPAAANSNLECEFAIAVHEVN